jgi:hypothetical protein
MTTTMPNPMEMLLKLFSGVQTQTSSEKPIHDTTLYKIETATNSYNGRIVHDDGVAILFMTSHGKSVKILKENVKSIVIVNNQNWIN